MRRPKGGHRPITGNAVRAAVMGANDGLVSTLNLVMGVAGAALPGRSIVIAGVAGLLAGAISMALGEWISVLGAAIPVLPFFVATGRQAIMLSLLASAAGLLVLGAWINASLLHAG